MSLIIDISEEKIIISTNNFFPTEFLTSLFVVYKGHIKL